MSKISEHGIFTLPQGLKFGLFPQCSVFLDLLHTTSHIVGKCLRSVMVGRPCSEQEIAHKKWLQSPLFSKGREEPGAAEDDDYDSDDDLLRKRPSAPSTSTTAVAPQDHDDSKDDEKSPPKKTVVISAKYSPIQRHQQFLQDLATLRPDSKAAEFHKTMFAQCKREMHDKMGGKVVDDTINAVIAAMLKHLGLIEIARKYANDYESTPMSVQERWSEKLLFVFKKVCCFEMDWNS